MPDTGGKWNDFVMMLLDCVGSSTRQVGQMRSAKRGGKQKRHGNLDEKRKYTQNFQLDSNF